MAQQATIDPIRIKYFDAIEKAEKWSGILFVLGAALSIAAVLVEEKLYPMVFQFVQVGFLVAVIALFLLDQLVRLYLSPRGADARTQDFMSQAYRKPLSSDRTEGYYNNSGTSPGQRIAAQTFENSLFTKDIAREMTKQAAPLAIVYIIFWLTSIVYRGTPLPLLATCSQVIFGEQIIARFLRLFWLQRRCEHIHDELSRIYVSGTQAETFDALAMDCLIRYEVAKAVASITLSSKIFDRMNATLSEKWNQLRQTHNI